MEIYNEKVSDLLSTEDKPIRIQEDMVRSKFNTYMLVLTNKVYFINHFYRKDIIRMMIRNAISFDIWCIVLNLILCCLQGVQSGNSVHEYMNIFLSVHVTSVNRQQITVLVYIISGNKNMKVKT